MVERPVQVIVELDPPTSAPIVPVVVNGPEKEWLVVAIPNTEPAPAAEYSVRFPAEIGEVVAKPVPVPPEAVIVIGVEPMIVNGEHDALPEQEAVVVATLEKSAVPVVAPVSVTYGRPAIVSVVEVEKTDLKVPDVVIVPPRRPVPAVSEVMPEPLPVTHVVPSTVKHEDLMGPVKVLVAVPVTWK